jgi:ribosomal protein L15E
MKVKCIYNKGLEKWLTIGKFYEVIYIDKYYYKINNDKWWFPKDL